MALGFRFETLQPKMREGGLLGLRPSAIPHLCAEGSMESEAASQLYWGSKLSRRSLTCSISTWYDDRATVYSVLLPPQPHRPGNVSHKTRASGCLRRVLRVLHTPQPDPPCAVAATALAGQNVRGRTQQSRRTGGSAVKVPTASPQACAPPRAPRPLDAFRATFACTSHRPRSVVSQIC